MKQAEKDLSNDSNENLSCLQGVISCPIPLELKYKLIDALTMYDVGFLCWVSLGGVGFKGEAGRSSAMVRRDEGEEYEGKGVERGGVLAVKSFGHDDIQNF